VVRGGQRGEMTQALYTHMNNKKIKNKKKNTHWKKDSLYNCTGKQYTCAEE
jgi:hypothetical protein